MKGAEFLELQSHNYEFFLRNGSRSIPLVPLFSLCLCCKGFPLHNIPFKYVLFFFVPHLTSTSLPLTKDNAATCPILERILTATPPGTNSALIKQYQSLILKNMMDYLQTGGKDDLMVVFREGALAADVERSLVGLGVFCSRIVDKVC